ncbi:MAG: hypothetical protein K2F57_04820 [Candidatus Gastranaerophilales bacterium]|nr:hypothetical protein [Candidatus Gastranaerophilales bacterium]
MNKNLWIICAVLFVFVTVFVIAADTSVPNRRVRFTNQAFEIQNKNNEIVNDTKAKVNFGSSNIENKAIKTDDSGIKLNSTEIENREVAYGNSSNFSNQETSFAQNNTEYSNYDNLDYKNVDFSDLDARLEQAKNISTEPVDISNKPFRMMPQNKYTYKNIDWSTWKSNFVNAILDESMSIKELDNYPNGAWFYYQFSVDSSGKISNIVVKSMYLDYSDKQKIIKLIKSFEYSELTIFPHNTKRNTAKVSAVLMLSNETEYSRPNNFNDFEQVKIKLD